MCCGLTSAMNFPDDILPASAWFSALFQHCVNTEDLVWAAAFSVLELSLQRAVFKVRQFVAPTIYGLLEMWQQSPEGADAWDKSLEALKLFELIFRPLGKDELRQWFVLLLQLLGRATEPTHQKLIADKLQIVRMADSDPTATFAEARKTLNECMRSRSKVDEVSRQISMMLQY